MVNNQAKIHYMLRMEGKDAPICPPTAAARPLYSELEMSASAKALSNKIQCVSQRSMQQVLCCREAVKKEELSAHSYCKIVINTS